MLANLPKWTGDASNLSGLAKKRNAVVESASWETDPAAEAEVAFLDGGATDDEPGGMTQPGERLRVYNLAGYGEPLLLSEVLISSRSLANEAAALSYMRLHAYDVRPNLLVLVLAQDMRELDTCHRYALNYLRAWCCRRGISYSLEVMVAAATDGLAAFYRLRELRKASRRTPPLATPATKERSKALRIRDDTYRGLRSVVLSALQDRYLEAVANFARALGSSDEMRLSHAEVRGGRPRRRGHAELQRRSSRNEESRRSVTAGAEEVWRKRAA